MAKKHFTTEEIIQHLRRVEFVQGKGLKLEDAVKKVGIIPQAF